MGRNRSHRTALIESLGAMRRDAELALHQAIYEGNQNGCSWRLLAKFTDIPRQTLHRRHWGRPTTMRPPAEDDTWLRSRRRRDRFTLVGRRQLVTELTGRLAEAPVESRCPQGATAGSLRRRRSLGSVIRASLPLR